MATFVVDVLVPRHFIIRCSDHYLLACFKVFGNHAVLNCVFACAEKSDYYQQVLDILKNSESVFDCQCGVVGIFRDKFIRNNRRLHLKKPCDLFSFCITFDAKTFEIQTDSLTIDGRVIKPNNTRVILYDSYELICSRLLIDQKQNYFLKFLWDSTQYCVKKVLELDHCAIEMEDAVFPLECSYQSNVFLLALWHILCNFILLSGQLCVHLFFWWPELLTAICMKFVTGRQLHSRIQHFKVIFHEVKNGTAFTLCTGNIISAILLDLLCGWLITYYLLSHVSTEFVLYKVMTATNDMMNLLQRLIYWLMGVPAGLKLNIPLNSALGHFFLYHIYLWKSYISIIQPLFVISLQVLMSIGMLGLTFIPCLVSDIISMATIHIYCFYGYAARLHYYQLRCLSALWRLFRGKKWNAELQRVESYTYDIRILYIGTLVFTVLLFLLPTVMVYYFVFAVLRIAVLTVQGIISKTVGAFSILPIFVVVLRIFRAHATAGDIFFSVLKQDCNVVLSLEVVQIPLVAVIQRTLPQSSHHEEPLSWKLFFSSLVWGKIIYPI